MNTLEEVPSRLLIAALLYGVKGSVHESAFAHGLQVASRQYPKLRELFRSAGTDGSAPPEGDVGGAALDALKFMDVVRDSGDWQTVRMTTSGPPYLKRELRLRLDEHSRDLLMALDEVADAVYAASDGYGFLPTDFRHVPRRRSISSLL